MNYVGLLLYFFSVYFTYYISGKHKSNPYIWTAIGFVVPFFSLLIAFLYFRKKEAIKNSIKLPLGFRSKTPWKMIISTIVYGFAILVISIGVLSDSNTVDTITSNENIKTSAVDQAKTGKNEATAKLETTPKSEITPTTEIKPTADVKQNTNQNSERNNVAVNGQIKIHYIDVGQADSILIQNNNSAMLIDAGNNGDASIVVNYIREQGISKLDYVIGTHPHEDHVGGLDAVISTFVIGKVIMPKVSSTTKTFIDVLNTIKGKGLTITTPVVGSTFKIGDATCTILAPNGSGYEDLNNDSVVAKVDFGSTSFLFTGDAEDVSENEMLSKNLNLKADVLKIGHHGSESSSTYNFIKAVSPKYAIISVGAGNDYGHPAQDLLNRLISAGMQILRTDEQGTIIAISDGKTITFDKKASPVKPQAPPTITNNTASGSSAGNTTVVVPIPIAPTETVAPTSQPEKQEITVYVTKTGEKYHNDGCRYLSKSKIPMSLTDAKKSYEPCSVCNPPR